MSRAPLFAQVLAVVVATAIIAQVVTLAAALLLPGGDEPFALDDVVQTVRSGSSLERNGFTLEVAALPTAPEGWDIDDKGERRARVTLADLLGVSPERVLVEDQIPVPGGHWLVQAVRRPIAQPLASTSPSPLGGSMRVEDMAIAVRQADGSWLRIVPVDAWPGPGAIFLIWLVLNAVLLVPLAWLFTRRVVEPIRTFAEIADRAGRGDMRAVFQSSGPREIRAAAKALGDMQRRIRSSVEERTKLLAAIAHDLRTPLTRIRFRAEHAPPEHRERIIADIERMGAMIDGVLAFARGEEFVERQRLDLTALVGSVVDDWADSGSDAQMDDAPAMLVDGDAIALRRMVSNLVDNGVKYGGKVRCRLQQDGKVVELLVEDGGPGIDPTCFARLLIPFERGDETRDPITGGVGLGLPIAHAIARAHGGELTLSEVKSGKHCVKVRLPNGGGDTHSCTHILGATGISEVD